MTNEERMPQNPGASQGNTDHSRDTGEPSEKTQKAGANDDITHEDIDDEPRPADGWDTKPTEEPHPASPKGRRDDSL